MTTPLGKGHRLSFGIGGVDDVDLLDRHDIGDIGVKVRGPRTSETRFGVRGSRFHIRFSFCRHFSLREIVRPRDPIVLLAARRAPTHERGVDHSDDHFHHGNGQRNSCRRRRDRRPRRTPQSKTKGSTAVLRKSPNRGSSSLNHERRTRSGTRASTSFSGEHVTDGTVKRDFSSQPAGVGAPSSTSDGVEVGVSMSLTSTVGDEDERISRTVGCTVVASQSPWRPRSPPTHHSSPRLRRAPTRR